MLGENLMEGAWFLESPYIVPCMVSSLYIKNVHQCICKIDFFYCRRVFLPGFAIVCCLVSSVAPFDTTMTHVARDRIPNSNTTKYCVRCYSLT